jgi:hypothetical protein
MVDGHDPCGKSEHFRLNMVIRIMTRLLSSLLAAAVVGSVCAVLPTTHAGASCLPDPKPSPHAFTGTVLKTRWDGRWAKVRTGTGRTVVVTGGSRHAPTSVDRMYQARRRYEFHPLNRRSPYHDNACTATHLIGYGVR